MTNRRAAIYARYSTENQSARSVDDQIALCESHAARSGLVVTARFSDAAVSGRTLEQRSAFMAMMGEARRPAQDRRFDVVIVEHADRLTRHPGDIHTIRETFDFAGIPVLQVNGGELDAMQAAVSGLVSSMMIKANTEKTIRGMAGRAAQGLRMGGRLYGYAPVKGEPGHVTVVEDQAAVVRRIFALYIAGQSARDIARTLNREGVPGPRGAHWNPSAIGGWGQRGNGIVGNEAYCGVVIWNKVKMWMDPATRKRVSRPNPPEAWQRVARPELAIIDHDTFAAAQHRRKGRRDRAMAVKPRHLLSRLLRCPHCGGSLVLKDGRGGKRRVQCSSHVERGTCSNGKTYNLTRIETGVVTAVRVRLDSPEGLAIYAQAYNAERRRLARAAVDGIDANRAERARVAADLDRAVTAVISGTMSQATAAPHIAKLEARRGELDAMLAAAARATVPVTLHTAAISRFREQLADLAAVVGDGLAAGDSAPAMAFRAMVREVTVHDSYELDIVGDLSPFVGGKLVAGEGVEPPTPGL